MLGDLGAGGSLAVLRGRIKRLRSEVDSLGPVPDPLPGMIDASNLLRKSEHLIRSDALKTDLIADYAEYASELESLLRSVFDIQEQLRGVLHDQNRLLSGGDRGNGAGTRRRGRPAQNAPGRPGAGRTASGKKATRRHRSR